MDSIAPVEEPSKGDLVIASPTNVTNGTDDKGEDIATALVNGHQNGLSENSEELVKLNSEYYREELNAASEDYREELKATSEDKKKRPKDFSEDCEDYREGLTAASEDYRERLKADGEDCEDYREAVKVYSEDYREKLKADSEDYGSGLQGLKVYSEMAAKNEEAGETLQKDDKEVPDEDKKEGDGEGAEKEKVAGKKSKEEVLELCNKRVEYLKENTQWQGAEALKNIKSISRLYWNYRKFRKSVASHLVELAFPELAIKMLKYFNEIGVFQNDEIWFPAYFTYNILWNFTDSSPELSQELTKHGLIPLLALNISHPPYLENQQSRNVIYLLKSTLSTLHNLIRYANGNPHDESIDLKTMLLPFMNSNFEYFKAISTMIITAIINEEENKMLEDTGGITFMVKGTRIALTASKVKRYRGFSPIELVECLSRMAVNDDNKKKIVDEGALPLLGIMLRNHKSVDEQLAAAKTLWVLSFDKEVAEKIKEEPGVVESLEKLSENDIPKLSKTCSGALWVIKGKAGDREKRETEGQSSPDERLIFISYCWSQQDVVIQIKDHLKAKGYKVWIDVEQMSGSTLEAMADGIERASVVLLCASENYKISPNCRTEAEYTFQLKKPIIPLMLQRRYRPDGWLGMMMGAKLYINFDGKYPFDQACVMLLKQLDGKSDEDFQHPIVSKVAVDTVDAAPMQMNAINLPEIKQWTSMDVMKWRLKHSLENAKLVSMINTFDGKRLHEFRKMMISAPEFFYKLLSDKMQLELTEILDFTHALEEL